MCLHTQCNPCFSLLIPCSLSSFIRYYTSKQHTQCSCSPWCVHSVHGAPHTRHVTHVLLCVFIQSMVHLKQDLLLMSYSVCSFSLWCTSNKTSYSCPTLCVHSIAPQTTHTHYSCLTPHVHSVHSALQTTHTLLKSHCAPIHSMAYLKTAHMLFTPHSMLTHSKVYLKTAHMKFIPHETSYNNTS